ncbi:MAG: bifunctional oligoribonuclease/PAP phosphatase NrnA [Bacilli bacterium]|jgi:phosphoesterase RecJ-like protein|nr:bifunctional oligoribonuclease/PAP phosphatase NrnA [Bacilli bacterium]
MNKIAIYNEILEKIKQYDTIIIHRHIRPDGDCIGSQRGLKEILKASFPEKRIFAVGDEIPNYLAHLGQNDEVKDEDYQNALALIIDTATEDRICDSRYKLAPYSIKIDHHDDSFDYADMNYIDPTIPATGALMVEFYLANKDELVLTQKAAEALYTAIVTDTGRFQYRGVNGEVLRAAAVLVDTGIDIEEIYSKLYLKDFSVFVLQSFVYKKMKQTPNGVVYIHFTQKIMEQFGVSIEDASSLVNALSQIKGSLIWVAFIDYPDGSTRVRIRSRFVPINDIATGYRGGGHLMAAGATIYNVKEKKKLLEELDLRLKEFKLANPEKQ